VRATEFITEANSTNLLVVDVQPAYGNGYADNIVDGIGEMIEKSSGKVVILFNGNGITPDDAHDTYQYIAQRTEEDEYGEYNDETDEYDEPESTPLMQKLQQAEFIEKEYGFLRTMMDGGVSDHTIIQVLRLMAQKKVWDSREIAWEEVPEDIQTALEEANYDWDNEGISFQDWVPIHFLKQLSPFYMMGGGRDECLREIELMCNAFNIRYKRVNSLIY